MAWRNPSVPAGTPDTGLAPVALHPHLQVDSIRVDQGAELREPVQCVGCGCINLPPVSSGEFHLQLGERERGT